MKILMNSKRDGFNYYQFQLALNPNPDIVAKIRQERKEFSEKYKTKKVFFNPHIMLVNFIHFEMIETRLVNHLKTISTANTPFQVKLKDYGSFPSHTIFMNVETRQQVQNLVTKLKPLQRLITLDKENKPHFMDDFYFTIGRKLLPWQYEKGWMEYSHRHFTGCFLVEELLLLKRPLETVSEGFRAAGSYQLAHSFEFSNSPVITKQGDLFM